MYDKEKIAEILNNEELTDAGKQQALRKYMRSCTPRHVLVVELIPDTSELHRLLWYSDQIRMTGNELTAIMAKRMDQMKRTRRWKAAIAEYRSAAEVKKRIAKEAPQQVKQEASEQLKKAGAVLTCLQQEFCLTWNDCRLEMIRIGEHYPEINSIFLLSKAEDVWNGVEKILYGDGRHLHFSSKGEYPAIRAKQTERGIVIILDKEGSPQFRINLGGQSPKRHPIGIKPVHDDRFLTDELTKLTAYIASPNEDEAIDEMLCGRYLETFRPCYTSFVLKEIRGRMRLFAHITIDGRPCRKYKKNGSPRHTYGTGRVANDIGTQSLAYTSDTEVGLENLSERGNTMKGIERQERLINRKMDRSRRATNPDNYKENGTIRKGKKVWKKSNRYRKLQLRHRELCRKTALSRKYAADEQAWHMRELGDNLITEPQNAKLLQRKTKKPEDGTVAKDAKGKYKRRKRFGKSIQKRCPGYYQSKVRHVFEQTGGEYHEVDRMFRASQYDHTSDDYQKKKLSERIFTLSDGTKVQRDSYSSFLLYCSDDEYVSPDRDLCLQHFDTYYEKEQRMENEIRDSHQYICNSGIRCA